MTSEDSRAVRARRGIAAVLVALPGFVHCGSSRDYNEPDGGSAGSSGRAGAGSGGSAGKSGAGGRAGAGNGSGGSGNASEPGGSAGAAGDESGGTDSAGGTGGPAGAGAGGEPDSGAGGDAAGMAGSGGTPPDPCAGEPCRNDGVCEPDGSTFSCECQGNYFGDTCETLHFEWLGLDRTSVSGISANGAVVVGSIPGVSRNVPGRWTAAAGWEALESFDEPIDQGMAIAANSDGSVIVGQANLPANAGGAFRWTAGDGVVSLGLGPVSIGRGVSSNGNTVVGTKLSGQETYLFRWTAASGSEDVESLGINGTVAGLNAAGTAVCGGYTPSGESQVSPFRWTQTPGLVRLGAEPGIAVAISADGNTVVGNSDSGPFSYESNGGYALLPLEGLTNVQVTAMSGNAVVMAGSSTEGTWLWDEINGMRLLADVLEEFGVDTSVWMTFSVYGISADGSVLAGDVYRSGTYTSWLARF